MRLSDHLYDAVPIAIVAGILGAIYLRRRLYKNNEKKAQDDVAFNSTHEAETNETGFDNLEQTKHSRNSIRKHVSSKSDIYERHRETRDNDDTRKDENTSILQSVVNPSNTMEQKTPIPQSNVESKNKIISTESYTALSETNVDASITNRAIDTNEPLETQSHTSYADKTQTDNVDNTEGISSQKHETDTTGISTPNMSQKQQTGSSGVATTDTKPEQQQNNSSDIATTTTKQQQPSNSSDGSTTTTKQQQQPSNSSDGSTTTTKQQQQPSNSSDGSTANTKQVNKQSVVETAGADTSLSTTPVTMATSDTNSRQELIVSGADTNTTTEESSQDITSFDDILDGLIATQHNKSDKKPNPSHPCSTTDTIQSPSSAASQVPHVTDIPSQLNVLPEKDRIEMWHTILSDKQTLASGTVQPAHSRTYDCGRYASAPGAKIYDVLLPESSTTKVSSDHNENLIMPLLVKQLETAIKKTNAEPIRVFPTSQISTQSPLKAALKEAQLDDLYSITISKRIRKNIDTHPDWASEKERHPYLSNLINLKEEQILLPQVSSINDNQESHSIHDNDTRDDTNTLQTQESTTQTFSDEKDKDMLDAILDGL